MNAMEWSDTLGGQALCLFTALLLSTLIGAERQARHKDAGTRTPALVGLRSALFVLTSKFRFNAVLSVNPVRPLPFLLTSQFVS